MVADARDARRSNDFSIEMQEIWAVSTIKSVEAQGVMFQAGRVESSAKRKRSEVSMSKPTANLPSFS
jgi:hypothetical protein